MSKIAKNQGCALAPLLLIILPFALVWIGWEVCNRYLGSGWWILAIVCGLSMVLAFIVSSVMGQKP